MLTFDHLRGWALYRNAATGATLLMHWHPDDLDTFEAEDGATWTRIAPVVRARTAMHARELIEAQSVQAQSAKQEERG